MANSASSRIEKHLVTAKNIADATVDKLARQLLKRNPYYVYVQIENGSIFAVRKNGNRVEIRGELMDFFDQWNEKLNLCETPVLIYRNKTKYPWRIP